MSAALLLPHDGSHVCCLLCAAQLNIANPSTGKQKLIEIEDEKKLCAAPLPCCCSDPSVSSTHAV